MNTRILPWIPLVDFGCRSTGRSYASQRGRDPKASEVETAGQCHWSPVLDKLWINWCDMHFVSHHDETWCTMCINVSNWKPFSVSQLSYKCQGDPFVLSFLEFILMSSGPSSGPSNMCRIPSRGDGCAYALHRSPAHSQCLQIASFAGEMSGDQVASGCQWCIVVHL